VTASHGSFTSLASVEREARTNIIKKKKIEQRNKI
jgi:hypothetical protein